MKTGRCVTCVNGPITHLSWVRNRADAILSWETPFFMLLFIFPPSLQEVGKKLYRSGLVREANHE